MAACGRGKRVRFWRVTELVTQLMEAREERVLQHWKAQLSRLDLLVLDQCGATNNVESVTRKAQLAVPWL